MLRLWLCSHRTDSCRLFNTPMLLFNGTTNYFPSPRIPTSRESTVWAFAFSIFIPLVAASWDLYSRMILIGLKAIKTDTESGKDLALIVTMCSAWEHWPFVEQHCLLMSLYSTLIFSRKGTGNMHWLGDAGIHLMHSLLSKPEQKSSSWLDLFWPRADQSRALQDPDKFPGW